MKKLFLMTAIVLGLSAFAQAQSAKMQSLMNDIKKEFPERQQLVAEKCGGAAVAFDVDFASFGDNYDALLRVPQQGLKSTSYGFRRFCTDSNNSSSEDAAKVSAVKSKVKKIVLKQAADKSKKKISLQKDGTVLIEMAFHDISGGFSDVEIQRLLGDIL